MLTFNILAHHLLVCWFVVNKACFIAPSRLRPHRVNSHGHVILEVNFLVKEHLMLIGVWDGITLEFVY